MSKPITISVILYRSKILANGEYPVMIRLTQDGRRKYVAVNGLSSDLSKWDKNLGCYRRSKQGFELLNTIIKKKLRQFEEAYLILRTKDKAFNLDSLVSMVVLPAKDITVFNYFNEQIDRMVLAGKLGNANIYRDTLNALSNFRNGKDLLFSELSVKLLNQFKVDLQSRGLLDTGMSIRFRTLRSLYNKAIEEGVATYDEYPFKQFKISKFNKETVKRAISEVELHRIEGLSLKDGTTIFEAWQYFLFCLYSRGLNFTDMAHLRWIDVNGDQVRYRRSKTGKIIQFRLLPKSKEIIQYWHPISQQDPQDYIFPILNRLSHKSPSQIKNRIHKVISRVNRDLKEIGKMAGINIPLTTYVARHTFANLLKSRGIPLAVISESLGHDNESTTQIYLNSLGNDSIDKAIQDVFQ